MYAVKVTSCKRSLISDIRQPTYVNQEMHTLFIRKEKTKGYLIKFKTHIHIYTTHTTFIKSENVQK